MTIFVDRKYVVASPTLLNIVLLVRRGLIITDFILWGNQSYKDKSIDCQKW